MNVKNSTKRINFSYSLIYFYLVKVCDEYDACRSQCQHTKTKKTIICYINGVRSIEKALATFGKDDRVQNWCCLACKYVLDSFVYHYLIFLFRFYLLLDWFQLFSQGSDTCLI